MTKATRGDALRLLAIDPGDVHVGMAVFIGPQCTEAYETSPSGCLMTVRTQLEARALDVLVVEEFRLYPWQAAQQAWSQMLTCQLIGAIKAGWGWFGEGVRYAEQSASIKKPTQSVLRGRKLASVAKAKKAGGHAFDAELHGWHWILNHD